MEWALCVPWLLFAPLNLASPPADVGPPEPSAGLNQEVRGEPKSDRAFFVECATQDVPLDTAKGRPSQCHTQVILKDGQVYSLAALARGKAGNPEQRLELAVEAVDASHVRVTVAVTVHRPDAGRQDARMSAR